MEKELKNYVSPQCEVMEMELQGMIAMSASDVDKETW